MTPGSAMIFAAGFGTRMGDLTQDQPKPMISIAGKPLVDHALDLTSAAGIANRVVNVHYRADMLVEHIEHIPGVAVSHEIQHPLETGGGLRHALPYLGAEPVVTLNPDVVWSGTNPLVQLGAAWRPDAMDALLILIPLRKAAGHNSTGDFTMDTQGRLSRADGFSTEVFIYAGAQITRTDGLSGIRETVFSLNVLWDKMISESRLFGCVYDGGWVDVGTPDGIPLAEKMLRDAGHV